MLRRLENERREWPGPDAKTTTTRTATGAAVELQVRGNVRDERRSCEWICGCGTWSEVCSRQSAAAATVGAGGSNRSALASRDQAEQSIASVVERPVADESSVVCGVGCRA